LDVTTPPPQKTPEDNTKSSSSSPSSSQQQQSAGYQMQSVPLLAWVAALAFIGIAAWLIVRYSKRSSGGDRKDIAYQPVV